MRRRIRSFFKELWNQLKNTLADKCGELPLGNVRPKAESREMKIGKTLYVVNSQYNGKENIVDKFKRLIVRKMESQSKES